MAYDFTGTQDISAAFAAVTGYPYTLHAIAVADSFSMFPSLVSLDFSGNSRTMHILFFNSNGVVRCGIEDNGSGTYVSATAVNSTGSAVVATFTATSTTINAYSNGGNKASASHSRSFGSIDRVRIGATRYQGVLSNYMDGRISEVAVWNVALTDQEVAALGAGFTPDQVRPQSLQFYAPLVRDLSDVRGGRVITNTGTATVANHPRIIT